MARPTEQDQALQVASLRRRKKADRPTDGTMTLMEHLYELRHRLFLAVLGIFLGTVIGFIWFANGIPAMGICVARRHPDRAVLRGAGPAGAGVRLRHAASQCQLLATTPFSILQLRLKAAIMAGAVISCPIWLYQLWAFITPALYSKERKFAVIFVSLRRRCCSLGGSVLAYAVISEGLKVLLGFGGDTTMAALSPDSLLLVPDRPAVDLRRVLRAAAAADHAELHRHGQVRQAGQVAAVLDLRDVRVRRAGGAGQRPDHHARAGRWRWPAVRGRRSRWPSCTTGARPSASNAAGLDELCPTTRRRRCRDPRAGGRLDRSRADAGVSRPVAVARSDEQPTPGRRRLIRRRH